MNRDISELSESVLYKGAQCSLNIRMVSAVVSKHDFIGGIQDSDLDSCGSDIYSEGIIFCNHEKNTPFRVLCR